MRARPLDGAREDVADAQLAADDSDIGATGEPCRRTRRDDEDVRQRPERRGDALDDVVADVMVLATTIELAERQDGKGRSAVDERRRRRDRLIGAVWLEPRTVDAHPARDVLQGLLAERFPLNAQPARHVIIDQARDTHAAAVGERLHPRRNVHRVAVDARAVHEDIAEVDADAEFEPSVLGESGIA